MKSCELCKSPARMYCESDQASLCWGCDAKVHAANFLVARHSRTLLCHVCQSPTAWTASGEKLGRTISVCPGCSDRCGMTKGRNAVASRREEEGEGCNRDEIGREEDECGEEDDDDESDDDDDDDDDEDDDEVSGGGGDDEDGDNQVVPWASMAPSPPAASSSSSEESCSRFRSGGRGISLKRMREDASDLLSDDDHGCSSRRNSAAAAVDLAAEEVKASFVDCSTTKPLKIQRTESNRIQQGSAASRSASSVISRLSKNPRAVDLNSTWKSNDY